MVSSCCVCGQPSVPRRRCLKADIEGYTMVTKRSLSPIQIVCWWSQRVIRSCSRSSTDRLTVASDGRTDATAATAATGTQGRTLDATGAQYWRACICCERLHIMYYNYFGHIVHENREELWTNQQPTATGQQGGMVYPLRTASSLVLPRYYHLLDDRWWRWMNT